MGKILDEHREKRVEAIVSLTRIFEGTDPNMMILLKIVAGQEGTKEDLESDSTEAELHEYTEDMVRAIDAIKTARDKFIEICAHLVVASAAMKKKPDPETH